ncbi:hypothetical protein DL767_010078 [Monosporascus sp. MG133]|nr:hypothetical protein DL767_010078 [Monosporascus sp. MG133]
MGAPTGEDTSAAVVPSRDLDRSGDVLEAIKVTTPLTSSLIFGTSFSDDFDMADLVNIADADEDAVISPEGS